MPVLINGPVVRRFNVANRTSMLIRMMVVDGLPGFRAYFRELVKLHPRTELLRGAGVAIYKTSAVVNADLLESMR